MLLQSKHIFFTVTQCVCKILPQPKGKISLTDWKASDRCVTSCFYVFVVESCAMKGAHSNPEVTETKFLYLV